MERRRLSFESHAEAIKLGVLLDWEVPDDHPQELLDDFFLPFELVFREGLEQGVIDRPVELVVRETWGLPKGSVKAVIDAYGELVDEGCLAVFGPGITENCVPTREAIEERFKVPAISMTGTEDWLGEWTFSLSLGSITDEPIFWARAPRQERAHRRRRAHRAVARGRVLYPQLPPSLCARRDPHRRRGVDRADGPGRRGAVASSTRRRRRRSYTAASVSACVYVNPTLQALDWDPPRFMGTAFQNAWINDALWKAMLGWTGVDQYDEGNAVGQDFLDRFEARYGRRPEYCVPLMNRDFATVLLHAFADAHPLTPPRSEGGARAGEDAPRRGRRRAGTRISFGKWTRRGWMGPGYLVARRLDPDGVHTHLVDRFGQG